MELIGKQIAIETILGQPPELHYPSWYAAQIEKLPPAPPEYLAEQAGILVTDADTISRAKAIEALKNRQDDGKGDISRFYNTIIQHDIEAIEQLPPAQPEPHWIPVTERLPEDDVYVLLTVRRMDDSYNHVPFISTGYISWNHQCWWCAHDGNCKDANIDVLAWMPLPDPYKGVTE